MFYKYKLNKFQERMFTIFIYVSYILIIISALNLSQTAPKLLSSLDYYVRIYICLFLLWRFNPLRKIDTFTNLDRKIAFSAGVFILTTTILNNYIEYAKQKVTLQQFKQSELTLSIGYKMYGNDYIPVKSLDNLGMNWTICNSMKTIEESTAKVIGSYAYIIYKNKTIKIWKIS